MSLSCKERALVRGSGNVFRDLDVPEADLWQLKSVLAAEIIKVLDKRGLTVRQAQVATGVAAADFSRVRNADLGRFTLDRLVTILARLGCKVQLKVAPVLVRAAQPEASAPGG